MEDRLHHDSQAGKASVEGIRQQTSEKYEAEECQKGQEKQEERY